MNSKSTEAARRGCGMDHGISKGLQQFVGFVKRDVQNFRMDPQDGFGQEDVFAKALPFCVIRTLLAVLAGYADTLFIEFIEDRIPRVVFILSSSDFR